MRALLLSLSSAARYLERKSPNTCVDSYLRSISFEPLDEVKFNPS